MKVKSESYGNYVVTFTLLSIIIIGLSSIIPSFIQVSKNPMGSTDYFHVGRPVHYLTENATLSGHDSITYNIDCPGGGAYPEVYVSAHSLYMKNDFAGSFSIYFRDSLGRLIWSDIDVTSSTEYIKRNAPGAAERYTIELQNLNPFEIRYVLYVTLQPP
jgi:hypothetical protein